MAGLYPPSAERRVLAGISRLAPAAATTRTRLVETGPGLRRCAGAERAVRLPFRRGTLLPAPGVEITLEGHELSIASQFGEEDLGWKCKMP